MWGARGKGSVFAPGPAKLRPGRCSRIGGWWRRDRPRRWGDAARGWVRRDRPGTAAPWHHTQALGLARWLHDTTSPSLLLPSFLYLSCSNMQAVTLHQGQRFPSLPLYFTNIFILLFSALVWAVRWVAE